MIHKKKDKASNGAHQALQPATIYFKIKKITAMVTFFDGKRAIEDEFFLPGQ
jgi:hypothetical protein